MTWIAGELQAELARLDRLLEREILRLRARYELSIDEQRGVYVSDAQVDALVAASVRAADEPEPIAALTRQASALADAIGDASPLGRFAAEHALDRFERDVLLLALAPELDLKYETLYAYLN